MRIIYVVCIALCALVVGCDQATLMKKWTRPEDESMARNYVDLLRQGKFDQIQRDFDPTILKNADARDTLVKMAALFPDGAPQSAKVVGARTFHAQGYSTTDITLEYEFESKWLLAEVVTKKEGADSTVLGFHVTPIRDSLENLNRFTLAGKSLAQYSILIFAAGSLAFNI